MSHYFLAPKTKSRADLTSELAFLRSSHQNLLDAHERLTQKFNTLCEHLNVSVLDSGNPMRAYKNLNT